MEILLRCYEFNVFLFSLLMLFSFVGYFGFFKGDFSFTFSLDDFTNVGYSFVGLLLFGEKTTFGFGTRCCFGGFCYGHGLG